MMMNSLQTNFPIFFPSSSTTNYSRSNRIRLSDPESSHLQSSSSSISSSSSDDEDSRFPSSSRSPSSHLSRLNPSTRGTGGGEDRSDELPDQFIPSKIDNLKDYLIRFSNGILAGGGGGGGGSIKGGSSGASGNGGSNRGSGGSGNGNGRRERKEAGIGSAFWGSRQGSIKLPTSTSNLGSSGSNRKQQQFSSNTTLLERVSTTSSAFQFTSSTQSSSQSQSRGLPSPLFDLGEEMEEDEGNSAVELPREIRIEDEERELGNWGDSTASKGSRSGGGNGGFPSRGLR